MSHRPDLPLAPGGGVKVGLGLWNSPVATLVTEVALITGLAFWVFALGAWWFDRHREARVGAD